jgi:signal transduction histidine kinase
MEALAVVNRELRQEIDRRQAVEKSLRESEEHYSRLLEQSRDMQEQLRLLSRQVLSTQEEERKKISRELHDVIAQTLTGINVRLAALKKEGTSNSRGLERGIARTQRLVQQSVDIVHQFARKLRPTMLDDLGLIPALHTFMKLFRAETGIRVSLSVFAAVEQLHGDKRTVLYRVAQEALTNVARHAKASQVEVKLQKMGEAICMTITDDGKGFQTERVVRAEQGKRLGLLGMRERLEIVGGNFTVTSTPGKGTTVLAQIPLMDRASASRTGSSSGADREPSRLAAATRARRRQKVQCPRPFPSAASRDGSRSGELKPALPEEGVPH